MPSVHVYLSHPSWDISTGPHTSMIHCPEQLLLPSTSAFSEKYLLQILCNFGAAAASTAVRYTKSPQAALGLSPAVWMLPTRCISRRVLLQKCCWHLLLIAPPRDFVSATNLHSVCRCFCTTVERCSQCPRCLLRIQRQRVLRAREGRPLYLLHDALHALLHLVANHIHAKPTCYAEQGATKFNTSS